jgi:hypothetical protein
MQPSSSGSAGSREEEPKDEVVVVSNPWRRGAAQPAVPPPQPTSDPEDASLSSDSGSDSEFGATPRRNFMFGMYSTHCGCFVVLFATIAIVALNLGLGGSPMFNGGYAVVPCANATVAADVPPRSAAARDVLWCRGPDVQTPLLLANSWFAVYCALVMVNWARYRRQYTKRVNWTRACVQGPVCTPLATYAVAHYSGADPSSFQVALACIAAALVPLQGYMHDRVSRRIVITDVQYDPGAYPLTAGVRNAWKSARFLVRPRFLTDAGATLLFTLLFLDAATGTQAGQFGASLSGTMSAMVWVVVLVVWGGVALRTASLHTPPGVYEMLGLFLAWALVYVPFFVAAMAPQVELKPRRH